MTDKLEALSQPVFEIEVSGNTWLNCSAENLTPTERADFSDWPDGINKLYSQEYVTALLAALEEKDKTLALVREQRDNELRTNTELEQRLQQPIKLPDIRSEDYHESGWFQHMKYYRDVARSIQVLELKVEGE